MYTKYDEYFNLIKKITVLMEPLFQSTTKNCKREGKVFFSPLFFAPIFAWNTWWAIKLSTTIEYFITWHPCFKITSFLFTFYQIGSNFAILQKQKTKKSQNLFNPHTHIYHYLCTCILCILKGVDCQVFVIGHWFFVVCYVETQFILLTKTCLLHP